MAAIGDPRKVAMVRDDALKTKPTTTAGRLIKAANNADQRAEKIQRGGGGDGRALRVQGVRKSETKNAKARGEPRRALEPKREARFETLGGAADGALRRRRGGVRVRAPPLAKTPRGRRRRRRSRRWPKKPSLRQRRRRARTAPRKPTRPRRPAEAAATAAARTKTRSSARRRRSAPPAGATATASWRRGDKRADELAGVPRVRRVRRGVRRARHHR